MPFEKNTGFYCECRPGYGGQHCETLTCDTLNCQNGGECIDGLCDCLAGYTGIHCEIMTRNLVVGVYHLAGSASNPLNFDSVLTVSPYPRGADSIEMAFTNGVTIVGRVFPSQFYYDPKTYITGGNDTISNVEYYVLSGFCRADTVSLNVGVVINNIPTMDGIWIGIKQ